MPRRTVQISLAAFTLLLLIGGPEPPAGGDQVGETEVRATLLPYFQAMRRGDLARMRPYLSDDLYKNYQVLFEQNGEYPRFLRHFYRAGRIALESVSADGDEATAHVGIKLASGATQTVVLTLVRTTAGSWQITRILE